MMGAMQITVRAEALGRRAPEVAVLNVRASHESGSQDESAGRAHELMKSLSDELRELQSRQPEVVERLVVLPVALRSWRPWNSEGKQLPRRFEATGRVEVALRDFGVLARLVEQWGRRDGVGFDAPRWELDEGSRRDLEAEVTTEAVRQARRRAEVMAAASGFTTVVPVQVADTGLLREAAGPEAMMRGGVRAAAFAAPGGEDEGFDLTPREVEVGVQVEAVFLAE